MQRPDLYLNCEGYHTAEKAQSHCQHKTRPTNQKTLWVKTLTTSLKSGKFLCDHKIEFSKTLIFLSKQCWWLQVLLPKQDSEHSLPLAQTQMWRSREQKKRTKNKSTHRHSPDYQAWKKKCLTSLATREMKMEIALRFCLIPVRVLVKNNKYSKRCIEGRTLDTAGGNVN